MKTNIIISTNINTDIIIYIFIRCYISYMMKYISYSIYCLLHILYDIFVLSGCDASCKYRSPSICRLCRELSNTMVKCEFRLMGVEIWPFLFTRSCCNIPRRNIPRHHMRCRNMPCCNIPCHNIACCNIPCRNIPCQHSLP